MATVSLLMTIYIRPFIASSMERSNLSTLCTAGGSVFKTMLCDGDKSQEGKGRNTKHI